MRIAEIFELGHRDKDRWYGGHGRRGKGGRKGDSYSYSSHRSGRKYRRGGGLLRISIGGY